jgi:hypothetical protein
MERAKFLDCEGVEATVYKRTSTGKKSKKGKKVQAIAKMQVGEYFIFVFPGAISSQDLYIKYSAPKQPGKNQTKRGLQHIHWLIDLLLKKEKNQNATDKFLKKCQAFWSAESKPIETRSYDSIKRLIDQYINEQDYFCIDDEKTALSGIGEYPVDFLACLFVLLSTEEKTNAKEKAHMFGDVINKLLDPLDSLDIYGAVNIANHGKAK